MHIDPRIERALVEESAAGGGDDRCGTHFQDRPRVEQYLAADKAPHLYERGGLRPKGRAASVQARKSGIGECNRIALAPESCGARLRRPTQTRGSRCPSIGSALRLGMTANDIRRGMILWEIADPTFAVEQSFAFWIRPEPATATPLPARPDTQILKSWMSVAGIS